jgi:hypothetical protein
VAHVQPVGGRLPRAWRGAGWAHGVRVVVACGVDGSGDGVDPVLAARAGHRVLVIGRRRMASGRPGRRWRAGAPSSVTASRSAPTSRAVLRAPAWS